MTASPDVRPFVQRPSFIFALAAISAMTATAIDISLPGQPAMAVEFGQRAEEAGVIIAAYFIGYGPGQLLWGPLADKYGRMIPLYIGLTGFLITSILCATADSLESISLYRLIQGIFGGSGPVIARAIARDQGGGKDTAKLMATILMIFGAAPLLAPLVGSGILLFTTWHGIFWFLAVFTVALMFVAKFFIAPSREGAERVVQKRVPLTFGLVIELFTHRDFLMGTLAMTTVFGGYAAILGIGAAMTNAHYGVTPEQFGVLFAFSASSVMIGPAISRKILGTRSVRAPLKIGAALSGIIGIAMLLCAQEQVPLYVLWTLVFLYCLAFSIMMPVANAIALEPAAHAAGTASSLLSALPTMGAALGAGLASSPIFEHGYEALTLMLAGGGIATCIIVMLLGGERKEKQAKA